MAGQAHHQSARYQQHAPRVTRAARATPLAVCNAPGCGRTLADHPLGANGKPQRWHAGHTIAGSTTWRPWLDVTVLAPAGDWLAPMLSRCNIADGNRSREPSSGWPNGRQVA